MSTLIPDENAQAALATIAANKESQDPFDPAVEGDRPLEQLPADLQKVLGMEEDAEEAGNWKSVVFQLSDGRECEIGPPPMPVDLVVPQFLPKDLENTSSVGLLLMRYERLMYVRKLSGKDVPMPGSVGRLMAIAQELGEIGFNEVQAMKLKYFPEATTAKLTVIKKNSY